MTRTSGYGRSRADRRRRLIALVIVFGMVLAAAATIISLMIG
ncbi:hypothetical protein [Blastococcus litoris]|nr:hypothetical protein [Blastococcus litoris]